MKRKHDAFYWQADWLKARKQARYDGNYQCARCGADLRNAGKNAQVHHRVPLKRAPHLALNPRNHELLCIPCHNAEHGRGKLGCDVDGTPLDPNHPWNRVG